MSHKPGHIPPVQTVEQAMVPPTRRILLFKHLPGPRIDIDPARIRSLPVDLNDREPACISEG